MGNYSVVNERTGGRGGFDGINALLSRDFYHAGSNKIRMRTAQCQGTDSKAEGCEFSGTLLISFNGDDTETARVPDLDVGCGSLFRLKIMTFRRRVENIREARF